MKIFMIFLMICVFESILKGEERGDDFFQVYQYRLSIPNKGKAVKVPREGGPDVWCFLLNLEEDLEKFGSVTLFFSMVLPEKDKPLKNQKYLVKYSFQKNAKGEWEITDEKFQGHVWLYPERERDVTTLGFLLNPEYVSERGLPWVLITPQASDLP